LPIFQATTTKAMKRPSFSNEPNAVSAVGASLAIPSAAHPARTATTLDRKNPKNADQDSEILCRPASSRISMMWVEVNVENALPIGRE